MSAWAYYTMRANASSQGPAVALDTNLSWSHQLSQLHPQSRPSPYHHRQQSQDESQTTSSSWGSLNLDSWGSDWLSRAVETVQTQWWNYKTGYVGRLDFERSEDENEYRRDEKILAGAEGRPYRYDAW